MLTLEAMIQRKKELGLSCRQISEISGVPLGTVQKIFSGKTTSPRHQTLKDLNKAFPINYSRPTEHLYSNPHNDLYDNMVAETSSYGVSKNPLDLDSYDKLFLKIEDKYRDYVIRLLNDSLTFKGKFVTIVNSSDGLIIYTENKTNLETLINSLM